MQSEFDLFEQFLTDKNDNNNSNKGQTMKKVFLSLDSGANKKTEQLYYTELINAWHQIHTLGTLVERGYTHRNGSQVIEPTLYFMNVTDKQFSYLVDLARKYEQESILVVDQTNNKAFLVYTDRPRQPVYIGQWTKVASEQLPDLDGFTRIADEFFSALPAESVAV